MRRPGGRISDRLGRFFGRTCVREVVHDHLAVNVSRRCCSRPLGDLPLCMQEGARRGKRGSSMGELSVLDNPTSRSGPGTTYQRRRWASATAERTALDCPGGFAWGAHASVRAPRVTEIGRG